MDSMYYLIIPLFLAWYFYPREQAPPPPPDYAFMYGLATPKEDFSETDENIEKKQVEEETPDGHVVMKYEDHYLYWSDKPISYKYLETVARKYVILYDCKENYVNVFKELYNASMEKEKEKEKDEKPSVFITKTKPVEKKVLIPEKCNKYIWKGKLIELEPKKEVTFKEIKFSDFKSIQST